MQSYTASQRLAICAGLAATVGAIGLLLQEPLTTGHWSAEHALTPLVVGLTIVAGHLVGNALRDRKLLAAFGFIIAFLIGTGVTVINGIGRQAEGTETKAAETEKGNKAIADKQAELTKARARYDQANAMAEKEMTGQKCGQRCGDWKTRAGEVDSHIRILEAQLSRLGSVKPVHAKADKVAELAAVFGADAAKVKAAVLTVEPVAVPFLLEWVAIVALSFGFGHRQTSQLPGNSPTVAKHSRAAQAVPATVANDTEPLPPKGGNRRQVATKAAAEADVIQLVGRGQPLPEQSILAARWGCHAGTASKWLQDFERRGLISRQRVGRCKAVAAA